MPRRDRSECIGGVYRTFFLAVKTGEKHMGIFSVPPERERAQTLDIDADRYTVDFISRTSESCKPGGHKLALYYKRRPVTENLRIPFFPYRPARESADIKAVKRSDKRKTAFHECRTVAPSLPGKMGMDKIRFDIPDDAKRRSIAVPRT